MIYFVINCLVIYIIVKYLFNFCYVVLVLYFDNGEIFGVVLLLLKFLKIVSFLVVIYGLSVDIFFWIWYI